MNESAAREAKLPSKTTTAPTSPASPSFPICAASKSLPGKLRPPSPVPLRDFVTCEKLAGELGIETDRLAPLLEHGYLRVLGPRETLAKTVVARPPVAAMDWLRTMFLPLELRPYIPIMEARYLFDMTEDELRYICVTENIPLYADPVFGELLSATGFLLLRQGLYAMRAPLRTDRQMLMVILGELKRVAELGRTKPLAYSERLENEIRRIVQLKEPEKTLRATDFWRAYRDADDLTDCLARLETTPIGKRIKKRTETLRKRLENQGSKRINATGNSSGESSGASPAGHSPADSTSDPDVSPS